MKKILVFLFILCAVGAFAQVTVLHSGDVSIDGTTLWTKAEQIFHEKYPNVKVDWIKLDLSDGSTLTMDAMLAAGTAPNVYLDNLVRGSKYMVPEYALDLSKIGGLDKFNDGVLTPYYRGGKLLGLPTPGTGQGMLVNLDIMKEIGFTVKDDWTVDDFLVMAEKVKQKYGGKKWATGMFAANQSGDYLINNWFASFGVSFYGSSYDVSTIADTGGAKVYEFFQLLAKNGYIPPNAATLNDDDYCLEWSKGNLAATAFFPSWTKGYLDSSIAQGLIKEPFKFKFVPFPRGPGVKKVPAYYTSNVVVVYKTGKKVDEYATELAKALVSAPVQDLYVKLGNLSNRKDTTVKPTDQRLLEIVEILKNGVQDVGLTDKRFTLRRSTQFPILQKVLTFKLTPDEAIKLYQQKLTETK